MKIIGSGLAMIHFSIVLWVKVLLHDLTVSSDKI